MKDSHPYRVNPQTETPPQVVRGPDFSYRYAYARSADSRAVEDPGQDYLTFRETDDIFTFALCDGVSQSFFGDLAARLLGDALLRWLEEVPKVMDAKAIGGALSDYLGKLTAPATQRVRAHLIPEDIAPMLHNVLVEKRALGSESTFLCGRIDLPSRTLQSGRLLIAWMGDSRLRFWGPGEELSSQLGDTFRTEQRWSTKRGLVNGVPHIYVGPLNNALGRRSILRVMAYSDGLAEMDTIDHSPSNYMLQDMIQRMGDSPTSDDISFLEIWLGKSPGSLGQKPTKQVSDVKIQPEGKDRASLSWKSLRRVTQYQIEVRNQTRRYWKTETTSWVSDILLPGKNIFRVRALATDGEPELWSKPVNFTVKVPKQVVPTRERLTPAPSTRPDLEMTKDKVNSWVILGAGVGALVVLCLLFMITFFFNDVTIGKQTDTPTLTLTATISTEIIAPSEMPSEIPPTDTATNIDTLNPTGASTATENSTPTATFTPSPTEIANAHPSQTATETPTMTVSLTP